MTDPELATQGDGENVMAFTFGDAVSVLDRTDILALLEVTKAGRWYHPPISMTGLVKAQRMSAHHASAMALKRNLLVRTFRPNRFLDRVGFARIVMDFLATGNCYLERIDSLNGRPMALKPSPALHTRVGVEPGSFFFLQPNLEEHEFRTGSVWHLMEPDIAQEIYGVPEWYAALQSGLLNEAATLFRRRYYLNGSHAGFILYIGEEGLSNKDSDAIRTAMRDAKGPGNFRNLFLHIPKGRKDGVNVIPISEVAARDDFMGIKNCSRDDMLAAHRTPPQLLGVVPTNNGGFGSIAEAAMTFFDHEIVPLQMRFMALNDWLGGIRVIDFDPYVPVGNAPGGAS